MLSNSLKSSTTCKSSFPLSRREWCGAGPALLRPQLGAARDLPPLPSADECDGGGGGECLDDQRQPRQSQGATDAAAAPLATFCCESHVYLQEIVLTCPEQPHRAKRLGLDKSSALSQPCDNTKSNRRLRLNCRLRRRGAIRVLGWRSATRRTKAA